MNTMTPNLTGQQESPQKIHAQLSHARVAPTLWGCAGGAFETYNPLVEIQNTKSQSWNVLLAKAIFL